MKKNTKLSTSMIRPMRGVKRGQALVITMVAFVALVGMTGFAIDIGHVYSQYQQLQDATPGGGSSRSVGAV